MKWDEADPTYSLEAAKRGGCDLGQAMRPLMRDPDVIESADVLVVESTYGNRLHKTMEATAGGTGRAIDETLHAGTATWSCRPSPLGRTQDLLALLSTIWRSARGCGDLHVFVDSPLAEEATDVTLAHVESLDPRTRPFDRGDAPAQAAVLAALHRDGRGLDGAST